MAITPSEQFDHLIAKLPDWRGETLIILRKIIHDADPEIVEEWKYMGNPVMYHDGSIVVVINAFKDKVKLGFLYGASLPDPDKLFNGELAGNQRRAVEFRQGDKIKEGPIKDLIRSAISFNQSKKSEK